MSRYELMPQARRDLRHIDQYYAAYSKPFVRKLAGLFRKCFARVGRSPGSGSDCGQLSAGMRSAAVEGRFIVYFRRVGVVTQIVRVMDGRRNITKNDFNPDLPDDDE
jgi:plasmid stabilization system protein ParE